MPRAIARIQFPGAFKAPRELTVEDWAILEAELGQQVPEHARKKMGLVVAAFMMRIPVEKNALSVVQTRKKISNIEKQARRLRKPIWDDEAQDGLTDFLVAQASECGGSHKDNLRRQLKRQARRNRSVSVLASLADSLDAVIANCDLAATRLTEPEEHVEDGFAFNALLISLWYICKANRLPFKIRKDSDKMSDPKQHSPFIRFIDKLQERLALHPQVSKNAMANRILRLDKRLPKRD